MTSQQGNPPGGREFDAYYGPHSNPPTKEKVDVMWRERGWELQRKREAEAKSKETAARFRIYGIWMGGAAAASTFISTVAAGLYAIWRSTKGGP